MSHDVVSMLAGAGSPITGDSKTIRGPQNKYFVLSRATGVGASAVVGIEAEIYTGVWVRLITITANNFGERGEGVNLVSPFHDFRAVLDSVAGSTTVNVDCCQ
ncbi:MAG: hypothetical protein KAJ73_00260 [Zetaproteobacteria bacterium]|nr:hypothetical protein [Zetaproteobacteria bacterium]